MKKTIRKAIRRALGKAPKPMPEAWKKDYEAFQTYEQ
jgi:hypothetical protein